MRDLLAGGFKLKHSAILLDRSSPKIEGAQLKKTYNRRFLMESIRTSRRLSPVSAQNIKDRSAPRIDRNIHIRFVERRSFLDNVLQGAENFYSRLLHSLKTSTHSLASSTQSLAGSLKGTTQSLAASLKDTLFESAETLAANLRTRQSLVQDIAENRALLKHIPSRDIKDRSKPFLPSPYALQETKKNEALARSHSRLLSEIRYKAVCRSLNHVSTHDSSKPMVSGQTQFNLHKWDRKKMLQEVESPSAHQLHNVTQICDRSAPFLPSGTINLHKDSGRKHQLLQEVKVGVELQHAEHIRDRSAPALAM